MTMIVGLTGGIASGKTLVGRWLAELGAHVIDADVLARQVVRPGSPALAEIAERFGPEVILPDGSLDRPRLGAAVFGDPEARRALEHITHPRIREAFRRRAAEAQAAGVAVVVYEAALLIETGAAGEFDRLIVVVAPPEVQVARVVERDGLTPREAEARLRAQATNDERLAAADHVLTNDGTIAALRAQVDALWEELSREQR